MPKIIDEYFQINYGKLPILQIKMAMHLAEETFKVLLWCKKTHFIIKNEVNMFGQKRAAEKRMILFVDDDEMVLQSLKRSLLDESYNKCFTKSCKDALEIIKDVEVHVIVVDMYMPEMTGLDFLRVARQEQPDVVGIVLTGYEDDKELQAAVEQEEIFMLVPNPWKLRIVDLESLIRQAVDSFCHKSNSFNSGIYSFANYILGHNIFSSKEKGDKAILEKV